MKKRVIRVYVTYRMKGKICGGILTVKARTKAAAVVVARVTLEKLAKMEHWEMTEFGAEAL